MKAFRNLAGNVIEIDVDIDLDGNPILPPDTTVNPRPEPQPGHYVTVVGNDWVQIPIPQEYKTFEYKKQLALEALSRYKDWYTNQPVEHAGKLFDGDELARGRLAQALIINATTGYLPPAWIAADNTPFPISTLADLQGIVAAVQSAFTTRFFEMDTIRQQILAATNDGELDAITIPTIPAHVM
jgi:hypothetical protein